MSDEEFKELGPIGQRYMETFAEYMSAQQLSQELSQTPESAEIIEPIQSQIERCLHFLHIIEPEASEEFRSVIEHVDPPEVARERANIMAIRDELIGLLPDEEIDRRIQAKLNGLPAVTPFAPDVTGFAAGFFMLRALRPELPTWSNASNSSITSVTDIAKGAEVAEVNLPATPEQLTGPKQANIVVYKGNGAVKVNDEVPLPLMRTLGVSKTTVEDEEFIAAVRLRALEVIAEHKDKPLLSSEIWKMIMPELPDQKQAKYVGHRWDYVEDLLLNLTANGEPLILMTKPTVAARRKRYQLNPDFATTLTITDEALPDFIEPLFQLESGAIISGRSGRILNALALADKATPMSLNRLAELGVIKHSERHSLDLRALISAAKSALRTTEGGDLYQIYSRIIYRSRDLNKKYHGYWMNEVEPQEEPQEVVDTVEKNFVRHMHEARSLADALLAEVETLQAFELPVLDEEIAEQIARLDALEMSDEDKTPTEVYIDLLATVSDTAKSEKVFNKLKNDDPRWALYEYIRGVNLRGEDATDTMELILADHDAQQQSVPIYVEKPGRTHLSEPVVADKEVADDIDAPELEPTPPTAPEHVEEEEEEEEAEESHDAVVIDLRAARLEHHPATEQISHDETLPVRTMHPSEFPESPATRQPVRLISELDKGRSKSDEGDAQRQRKIEAFLVTVRPHIQEVMSQLKENGIVEDTTYPMRRYARIFGELNNSRIEWSESGYVQIESGDLVASREDIIEFILSLKKPLASAMTVGFKRRAVRSVIEKALRQADRKNGNGNQSVGR